VSNDSIRSTLFSILSMYLHSSPQAKKIIDELSSKRERGQRARKEAAA
jgi:heme exporter protein D